MKKALLLLLLGFAALPSAIAQKTDKSAAVFSTASGAIAGYDPVAYFTQSRPVKGQPDIAYAWNGTTWHFASAANRDLFQQSPEKYAPQFGGWCAYGWAQGYPAKIEPEAWSIVDDKLYLNYDPDIQKKWLKKQAEYIQKAVKNYAERK